MGAKSCLKILVLKHLTSKPLEEFVATFSKDRVLSKIKHPTQKWGNSLEEFQLHHRFLHQVFHSDFLNLWLVALGRKCMAWLRGYMRKTTRGWIHSDLEIGQSGLEQAPEAGQDRRGQWGRRGMINLPILPHGNKKIGNTGVNGRYLSRFLLNNDDF